MCVPILPPVVHDNGDGTYTASYVPSAAGADEVSATLGFEAVGGGPLTSTVTTR